MKLSAAVISEITQLEQMSAEWEALQARSDSDEPALAPLWILPWWRVFGAGSGRTLRVGVFRDGSRLVGLVPLVSRWVWRRGMPLRRLEALPSGEDEDAEIASEYIGAICESGFSEEVAASFADALVAGAFGAFDELVLPAMNGALAAPAELACALMRRGLAVTVTERCRCPYVPLKGSFEVYLAELPASRRYRVTRALRDFERWAEGDVVFSRAGTLAEVRAARATLERLHEARWQERGRPGVFSAARFSAFHDAVMPALFARGALSLSTLFARGEPIAALYNVVWNGKIHFYQSGRRVDLPAKIKPGIVAHALAIRAAIAEGLREYDFLGGASRYKTELALATRPLVSLRAARRTLRGALVTHLDRAAARLHERSERQAERDVRDQ